MSAPEEQKIIAVCEMSSPNSMPQQQHSSRPSESQGDERYNPEGDSLLELDECERNEKYRKRN
jgi:hypothetical protein